MSSSEGMPQTAARRTTITLVTGERHSVEGFPKDVERIILDAARGSIMELAWFIHSDTREELGINPEYVVMLRAADHESD